MKRVFILTGETVDVMPPPHHLVLNEMGEKDKQGIYIIPERVSEQSSEFEKKSLQDIFPEISQVFGENLPRNMHTLQSQSSTLQKISRRLSDLYATHVDKTVVMQRYQRESLLVLKKYLNTKISSQDEVLKEHDSEFQRIKNESQGLNGDEIAKSLLAVRRDSSGSLETFEEYINQATIDRSVQFIRLYLQPGKAELENAVTAACKKLHQARSIVSSLEETGDYSLVTNLSGPSFEYDTESASIARILGEISELANALTNLVSEIGNLDPESKDLFPQYDINISTREWVSELRILYNKLIEAVQKCHEKKELFNKKITKCTKAILSVLNQLDCDSQDSQISSRFKEAQESLQYLKYARNLNQVYRNCMDEKSRRKEVFGEEYRKYASQINETVEDMVKAENRIRREFLKEQQKLLGGHEIPANLVPRITELVEAPAIASDAEEEDEEILDAQNLLANWSLIVPKGSDFADLDGKLKDKPQSKSQKILAQELIQEKERQIEEQQRTIETLRAQLESDRVAIQEANEVKRYNEKRFADLYQKFTEVTNLNRTGELTIEKLKKDLQESRNEVSFLKGTITADNNEKTQQLAAFRKETAEAKNECEQYKRRTEELMERFVLFENEKSALEKNWKKLQQDLAEANAKHELETNNFIEKHRQSYEKEQLLSEALQTANSKISELNSRNQKMADVVLQLNQDKQDLANLLRQKEQDAKNLLNASSHSVMEESLRARIMELERDLKAKTEQLKVNQQIVQQSAKAVDVFKENFQIGVRNALQKSWIGFEEHMRTIQTLKGESVPHNKVLANLSDQLQEIIYSMRYFSSIIHAAKELFSDFEQFSTMMNESREAVQNVCNALKNAYENMELKEYVKVEQEPKSDNPFSTHTQVLFTRSGEHFLAVSENSPEIYYLDPDSYRAFLDKYKSNAKNRSYILGEVIQVIQRDRKSVV